MVLAKGTAALGVLNSGSDEGARGEFTKIKSGESIKVLVKGTEDLAQFFSYGIYKKVNSFVPKSPAERNEKGFVTGNQTPWDLASQYYYDLASKETDAKKKEELQKTGYLYKGKPKFMMGFHLLETGEDIVVEMTKNQALSVYAVIMKNEKKLDRFAFELSKTGESTSTTLTLSLLPDMDEDLTQKERENFEKAKGQPFNSDLFDGLLYEMDEAEQIENLVKAGFDPSLIGLAAGAGVNDESIKPTDNSEPDPTEQF